MKTRRSFALGCFAPLLLSSGIVYAGGPAGGCLPINSIPKTINTSGIYCLARDVSTSVSGPTDAAILINADNVIIDLQEHVLDGSPAGVSTQATGIRAQDRNNITVRNGTIRGFLFALSLQDTAAPYDDTGGHLVTGVRAVGNTAFGIEVGGRGNRVVDNVVLNTGGAVSSSGLFYEMNGIGWDGPDARILRNDIINVHNNSPESPTWGITAGGAAPSGSSIDGSIVEDNRISNISNAAGAVGIFGIAPGEFGGSIDGTIVAGNTITNPTAGTSTHGISLGAGALCRNNTIFRFTSGIGSCTDGGGNAYYP